MDAGDEHISAGTVCQNLNISHPELCAQTWSCGPRRAILCFATWLRATPTHELQKGLHGLAACGVQLFAKFLAEHAKLMRQRLYWTFVLCVSACSSHPPCGRCSVITEGPTCTYHIHTLPLIDWNGKWERCGGGTILKQAVPPSLHARC